MTEQEKAALIVMTIFFFIGVVIGAAVMFAMVSRV